MQFEEETLEILEPNAAMSPILKALDAALAVHTGPDPQPPREFAWEEIPFAEVARTAAAFPLLFEGWAEGAIPATEYSAGDLLHELSSDLDIMSAEDLHERFLLLVEGARASADFRRIMAAPSVKHLVRNEAGLGWSGFEVVPKNTELLERMRRKRMTADHFRGKFDWTALRGWDLALGAALITKAQAADMLTDEEALDYFRRIAGELLLRMTSRQALAQCCSAPSGQRSKWANSRLPKDSGRPSRRSTRCSRPKAFGGGRRGCSKKRMPIRRQFTYKAHKPYCLFGPVIA